LIHPIGASRIQETASTMHPDDIALNSIKISNK